MYETGVYERQAVASWHANDRRAGHVASGGGLTGPPQQRSSLKLSRAGSSNLSTSDEPQPLLSRSAESLHGASAAVRRAKQEVQHRLYPGLLPRPLP